MSERAVSLKNHSFLKESAPSHPENQGHFVFAAAFLAVVAIWAFSFTEAWYQQETNNGVLPTMIYLPSDTPTPEPAHHNNASYF